MKTYPLASDRRAWFARATRLVMPGLAMVCAQASLAAIKDHTPGVTPTPAAVTRDAVEPPLEDIRLIKTRVAN